MFKDLPPLNALRAFESAARLLSFTLAGKELFVTHGAISKQIKLLEAYLGLPLFIRLHRQLVLTDEGQRYLPHVQTALQSLNNATYDLKSQPLQTQTLSINVLPSLSINWLIPRIEEFKSQYPNLFVDLSIGDFPVDFAVEHFYMLSQAAVSGIGMALIPRFFIEKELKEGSLVLPFTHTFISPYRYYILTSNTKQLALKTQVFIDWLLDLFSHYRKEP
ncbi:LysR family transcriptional regulator [uncultured Shewanella sp.]|uniref:LysR family transcriptional regulator n=1 Tax=uncultured Shewanella sp. TaxID=173975 RepID=UPI00261ADBE6|nr:LysR family transcriptional regulator [uncultured Shewanella sp.]